VQINEGDSPARTDPAVVRPRGRRHHGADGGRPDLDRGAARGQRATGPGRQDRAPADRLAAGQLPDAERHRGDARRRSGQGDPRRRAPRQRRPGPGINDNGSGSAALLEFAQQLRNAKTKNKIRFVWFSAEESGLLGSEAYVASLPDSERAKIAAMLNFDMIGSPNYVNFVYDGDLSDSDPLPDDVFAPAARPFSATIEQLFLDYYASQHIPNEPTAFDGRSDYGPFIAAGSRPAASSPAPRGSRRRRSSRCSAAPRVSSTTSATTSAATTSSTTPTARSTRTRTPPPTS
jgi:hypothetical protein